MVHALETASCSKKGLFFAKLLFANCCQVRMWYMQGLEKLWQLQLYSAATDIIKHCGDPYISQMHAQNTT